MNESLFKRLLDYYHLDEKDYQELIKPVDENNFAFGHEFKDIDKAIDIINETIDREGKIFIYGDYDADGVMGCSILVKMFLYRNVQADYYLPNRYVDGYGLTLKKAQECIDNKVSLVITIDNGVSALEPIKLLKDNGIKILVLDHHTVPEELPPADVILHPQYSDFGETPASAGFVSFMFSIKFLGYYDKYLATLASISLISDMMPLLDYNRNLLRVVFSSYKDGEFFPIDALKEGEPFNEVTIGMRIAPKINAIGRLINGPEINRLVTFFTSNEKEELLHYIEWINSINEERKLASKESASNLGEFSKDDGAIVYITEAKEGLLGLIANSLMNTHHVPVIVMTLDQSGEGYKGSCRAPEGFNVAESFENLKEYMLVYGGHAGAGGCTVLKENIEAFTKAFKEYATKHPPVYVEKEVIDLSITEVTLDNYRLIHSFSPFGEGHKAPLFKIRRVYTPSLSFSRNGEHILTPIGNSSKIVGFNISKQVLQGLQFIDIIGTLKSSSYKGYSYVEFNISKYEPTKA